jgi:hypothetical protein
MRALPPECLDRHWGYASVKSAAILILLGSSAALAQGVRITGVTSMQAVDLRPLVEDSVPVGLTTGSGPYRVLDDGRLVRCVEGEAVCRFRSSGSREMVAPVVQDLRAVAWGFGEGISFQAHVRARGSVAGGDSLWPRAADAFDAIEAWMEVDRGPFIARLGRQWAVGGLGVYNFDGASLQFRYGRARLEAFGGRSLIAGLNEPIAGSQLGALDDLPPDEHGWLVGLSARAPLSTRGVVGATWQRVIRGDRAALYSDRVAVDGVWRLSGVSADASLAWDVSGQEVNDARLRLARVLRAGMSASVEARRIRPFFEAWTIWGAFSPVAFDELRGAIDWRNVSGSLALDVRGARRRYDETNAGLESTPLKRDGWRAGVGGEWSPAERWLVFADYDVDIGFGASRSDVAAGARWMPDEARWVGVSASGLQHIYEFRIGTGRVTGLRVDAGTRITSRLRLLADAALYSHHLSNGAMSPDWSQRRASLRLEWTAGSDAGRAASERRAK